MVKEFSSRSDEEEPLITFPNEGDTFSPPRLHATETRTLPMSVKKRAIQDSSTSTVKPLASF